MPGAGSGQPPSVASAPPLPDEGTRSGRSSKLDPTGPSEHAPGLDAPGHGGPAAPPPPRAASAASHTPPHEAPRGDGLASRPRPRDCASGTVTAAEEQRARTAAEAVARPEAPHTPEVAPRGAAECLAPDREPNGTPAGCGGAGAPASGAQRHFQSAATVAPPGAAWLDTPADVDPVSRRRDTRGGSGPALQAMRGGPLGGRGYPDDDETLPELVDMGAGPGRCVDEPRVKEQPADPGDARGSGSTDGRAASSAGARLPRPAIPQGDAAEACAGGEAAELCDPGPASTTERCGSTGGGVVGGRRPGEGGSASPAGASQAPRPRTGSAPLEAMWADLRAHAAASGVLNGAAAHPSGRASTLGAQAELQEAAGAASGAAGLVQQSLPGVADTGGEGRARQAGGARSAALVEPDSQEGLQGRWRERWGAAAPRCWRTASPGEAAEECAQAARVLRERPVRQLAEVPGVPALRGRDWLHDAETGFVFIWSDGLTHPQLHGHLVTAEGRTKVRAAASRLAALQGFSGACAGARHRGRAALGCHLRSTAQPAGIAAGRRRSFRRRVQHATCFQ